MLLSKRLLVVLLSLLLPHLLHASKCMFALDHKLYNLAQIETDMRELNLTIGQSQFSIFGRMCQPLSQNVLSKTLKGRCKGKDSYEFQKFDSLLTNVVLVDHQNCVVRGIAHFFDQLNVQWSRVDNSERNYVKLMYSLPVSTADTSALGDEISQVVFMNTCFTRTMLSKPFIFGYVLSGGVKSHGEIVFQVNSNQGCGEERPNVIRMLSNNFVLMGLLLFSSIGGVLLGKKREQLALSVSSIQAAVVVGFGMLYFNSDLYLGDRSQFYFSLYLIVIAFIFFGFSYFSRYFSLIASIIAVSYAIVATLLYIISIVFAVHLSIAYYLVGVPLAGIGIGLLNYFNISAREKYSFIVFTSISISYYFCLAIFIKLEHYLDILNYNKYKSDYNIQDPLLFKNWWFLFVQLGITLILLCYQLQIDREETKAAIESNAKLFDDKMLFIDTDPYHTGDKQENETVIAM